MTSSGVPIVRVVYYIVLYLALLVSYRFFIYPVYEYQGFSWSPDNVKICESFFLVLIISLSLAGEFKKPSDLLLHILVLFPILPMIVLYGASDFSREFIYYTIVSYGVIVLIARNIKLKIIGVAQFNPSFLARILLFLALCYIASIFFLGGWRYLNFDLKKVYEFRSVAAASLPSIYNYLTPTVSKVILPFALLLAVRNRDWFVAVCSIVGSVFMFALSNHKAPLFYPFVILAFYFLAQRKNIFGNLFAGCLMLIGLSALGFMCGGLGNWVGSLLLRRTFFVPSRMNFVYYDFFSQNHFVYWADSKLSLGLVPPIYDLNIPHLIGREIFSSAETSANTGFIGSGYAQFGFIGMIFYALIIGFLLCVIDAYSHRVDKTILVAIITAPMAAVFRGSDLPTAFLTHGVLVSLMLLSLFKLPDSHL